MVAERVDDQQDAAVLLGRRGGHVQLAAPRGDPPADLAQPVAGPERADVGELDAGAEPRRAVHADQADRSRGLGARVEARGLRQHPQARRRAAAPAPTGSPPTAWSGRPAPRPAPAVPTGVVRSRRPAARRPARRPARSPDAARRTAWAPSRARRARRPSPSTELRAARWCPGPRAASGGRAARREWGSSRGGAAARGTRTRTNGAPSTITAGVPPTTAATTATAPTTTARARAGVGRQRRSTASPGLERRGRRHLGEHRVDDAAAAWSASSRAPGGP